MRGQSTPQGTDAANTQRRKEKLEKAADVGTEVLGFAVNILDVAPEDPFGITKSVFCVTKVIYDQVKLVRANKEQFKRLAKRIAVIENAIRRLDTIPNSTHYKDGLMKFQDCVNECLSFVRAFGQKHWFKKVLGAGMYSEKFNGFNHDLKQVMQDLNLGMHAQQIVNHEQDKQDQERDHADIMARYEEIKALQQESIQMLQELRMEKEEREAVLKVQEEEFDQRFKRIETLFRQRDEKVQKPPISSKDTIYFYDLAIDRLLQRGSFANIYLGKWLMQPVAIKKIEGQISQFDRARFIREVQIMRQLRSPYITSFQGACLESNRSILVMEYMEEGSLYDFLGRQEELKEKQRANIALEVAKGLLYLHTQGLIHRDLKSGNILLNRYRQAKITDFGLSKIRSDSIETIAERAKSFPWMAPELFEGESSECYSQKSDIYAYGVIVWELITGKRPYDGCCEREIIEQKKEGTGFLEMIEQVPSIYVDIIRRCVARSPSERPELVEIVRDLERYIYELETRELNRKGEKLERRKEYARAEAKYRQAKDRGYGKACLNLGFWHTEGIGGKTKNYQEAYDLYLEGSKLGNDVAQYNLGQMLEYGVEEEIKKDLLAAYEWYIKSAKQGNKDAQGRLERMKEKMQKKGIPIPTPQ